MQLRLKMHATGWIRHVASQAQLFVWRRQVAGCYSKKEHISKHNGHANTQHPMQPNALKAQNTYFEPFKTWGSNTLPTLVLTEVGRWQLNLTADTAACQVSHQMNSVRASSRKPELACVLHGLLAYLSLFLQRTPLHAGVMFVLLDWNNASTYLSLVHPGQSSNCNASSVQAFIASHLSGTSCCKNRQQPFWSHIWYKPKGSNTNSIFDWSTWEAYVWVQHASRNTWKTIC